MKKVFVIIFTFILICSIINVGNAAINADEYFASASITLYTYEAASFSAATNFTVGSIKIDSCWLQKWDGSRWNYYCWLPAPADIETNTFAYGAYMDYASYIPNDGGTYRIGAYYNADGHTIPRYSNSRTFN